MKQHDITKICADSLRAFLNEKYGIKLGSSHAHEMVAAFFGYQSRAAMRADTKYPPSNLHQAQIIVMAPDVFIDGRRKDLQGLSSGLPDSYPLGEGVYSALFSEQFWSSPYPPFRSFEKMATYIADEDIKKRGPEGAYRNHASEDIKIERTDDIVKITVFRFYRVPEMDGIQEATITTTITLRRLAGHIGYSRAHVSVELEPLGIKAA